MGSAMFFDFILPMAGTMELPSARGRYAVAGCMALAVQPLATDPIGGFELTLTNLVPGSAVQVEDQAGTTTLYNGVAGSSSL